MKAGQKTATGILLVVAVVLVWRDRALFFARPDRVARS